MEQYKDYKTHNENIKWFYFLKGETYYIIHNHYGENYLATHDNYDDFKNELLEYGDYYCLEENNIVL